MKLYTNCDSAMFDDGLSKQLGVGVGVGVGTLPKEFVLWETPYSVGLPSTALYSPRCRLQHIRCSVHVSLLHDCSSGNVQVQRREWVGLIGKAFPIGSLISYSEKQLRSQKLYNYLLNHN